MKPMSGAELQARGDVRRLAGLGGHDGHPGAADRERSQCDNVKYFHTRLTPQLL
jgi:hypothetical protein